MRTFLLRMACAAIVVSNLGHPGSAWAVTPAEKAAAEALFDEGVTALKEGNVALACEKLESSQRIEAGVGVLLYLGDCYEKQGRTASAWAIFREAASIANARGDDRAPIAQERAERLTPRLSKLTITMEVGKDTEIAGLEIMRDGESIPRALWGSAIPVDPGEHVISVTAPGYTKEEVTVMVEGEAAVATVSVPHIAKLPASALPPASGAPVDSASSGPNLQRPIGIGVAIAGAVGLAAGATFGVLALTKNDEVTDPNGPYRCTSNSCPTAEGASANDMAQTFATIADVSFIAGGVLAATGLTLIFTAPSQKEVARLTPALGPGLTGLRFEGSF